MKTKRQNIPNGEVIISSDNGPSPFDAANDIDGKVIENSRVIEKVKSLVENFIIYL